MKREIEKILVDRLESVLPESMRGKFYISGASFRIPCIKVECIQSKPRGNFNGEENIFEVVLRVGVYCSLRDVGYSDLLGYSMEVMEALRGFQFDSESISIMQLRSEKEYISENDDDIAAVLTYKASVRKLCAGA